MEVVLDTGVELFVRRGWYDLGDIWSPTLYRHFILPSLKRETEMARQAGAKLGYIMTSGQMPLLDILLDSGVDVLIGLDPVRGRARSSRR